MKQIKFNKHKYTLPENWSEVKFSQFKEILKLSEQKLGQLEAKARKVSVLSGLTYDELIDGDPLRIEKLFSELEFITKLPETEKPITSFTIGRDTFYVKSLLDANLREFADYQTVEERYLEDQFEGYTLKLAILCRKYQEPTIQDDELLFKRAKLFENLDAGTVMGIVSFFFTQTKAIKDDYPRTFSRESSEPGAREQLAKGVNAKWGWYGLAPKYSKSPLEVESLFNTKATDVFIFQEYELDIARLQEGYRRLDQQNPPLN